jgi:hypothetical protein
MIKLARFFALLIGGLTLAFQGGEGEHVNFVSTSKLASDEQNQ